MLPELAKDLRRLQMGPHLRAGFGDLQTRWQVVDGDRHRHFPELAVGGQPIGAIGFVQVEPELGTATHRDLGLGLEHLSPKRRPIQAGTDRGLQPLGGLATFSIHQQLGRLHVHSGP